MLINLKILALLIPLFVSSFWAVLLFLRNRSPRQPGFYIAFLMTDLFLLFLSIIPFYNENFRLFIFLDPVFLFSSTMIFPLVYFYVRAVAKRKQVNYHDLYHFIMPVLFLLSAIFIHSQLNLDEEYIYANDLFKPYKDSFWLRSMHNVNMLSKYYIVIQIIYYFILSSILIKRFKERVKDYFSHIENHYFRWIAVFYTIYISSALAGVYMLFLGNSQLNDGKDEVMIISFLILSIFFFIIAYIANDIRYIENGEFYIDPEKGHDLNKNHKGHVIVPEGLKQKLSEYFEEEKPFLNPHLKITDVSSQLQTNRTYISYLIRDEYQTNFSGYVNSWRVKEAIGLFEEKNSNKLTTKGISESVGFNNYNSFVKAFRELKGVTPGRFREG